MTTSRRSRRETSLRLNFGLEDGPAKTSATEMPDAKASTEHGAAYSSPLRSLLEKFDRDGLSWKTSRGSSARTTAPPLSQLSRRLEEIGYMGVWFTCNTLSAGLPPQPRKSIHCRILSIAAFPSVSVLTAANCLGIIRREQRAGRDLDPVFEESLSQTLRFWSNVAEVLGTPKQQAIAPRYAPSLESIKAATPTDRSFVARNLTWDECEKTNGIPGRLGR